jgi:predicted secreted protein
MKLRLPVAIVAAVLLLGLPAAASAAGEPATAPTVAGLCATDSDYFWIINSHEELAPAYDVEYRAAWEGTDWMPAPQFQAVQDLDWAMVVATSRSAGSTISVRWADAPSLVGTSSAPDTTACQSATFMLTIDVRGGSAAATDFVVPLTGEDPNPPFAARASTNPAPDTEVSIQPGAYLFGSKPPAVPAGYIWLSNWCMTSTDSSETTSADHPRLTFLVVPGDYVQCIATYSYGPFLDDSIAAGKNATSGLGTEALTVPKGTWITYHVSSQPNLAGRSVEIWRKTGGTWAKVATRAVAADGSVRYSAAVTKTSVFQARWPADAELVASHSAGKTVTVSATGAASLSVTCVEFYDATGENGVASVTREIWVKAGQALTLRMCENASTGYTWTSPRYNAKVVRLVGHKFIAPASNGMVGVPGTAVWNFKALKAATSTISLSYDQPWSGGDKGSWKLSVVVHAVK